MRASVLHIDQFSYLSPDLRSQKDCRRCFQPGLEESNRGGKKKPKPLCFCFVKPSLWSVCVPEVLGPFVSPEDFVQVAFQTMLGMHIYILDSQLSFQECGNPC